MRVILWLLTAANIAAFLWFLYEITRLEKWPGRFWHHAYLSAPLVIGAQFVTPWLAVVMLGLAFLLIYDDAGQHHVHNRMKRAGVPMHKWPVSWLHRNYELLARAIHGAD